VAVDELHLTACEPCRQRLQRAVQIYHGDFIAGFSLPDSQPFAEWALFKQEELRGLVLSALEVLASHHLRAGDYEQAAEYARRQLEIEPWREEAHNQRMRALAPAGQREAALRQFEQCRRVLADELREKPSPGLVALRERIRAGALAPEGVESAREPAVSVAAIGSAARVPIPAFVARESELAALNEQLARALAGQGRVVFVTGEAGSGKTSLLSEFARRTMRARGDLLVAAGRCTALGGVGDPYLPFREIFRMLAADIEPSLAGGAIAPEHADRLLAALPVVARALVETGGDVLDRFGLAEPLLHRVDRYVPGPAPWHSHLETLAQQQAHRQQQSTRQAPPGLPQAALFDQVTATFRAIVRRHPLLLLLDDLQWVDRGSSSLLFHLGRRLAGRAILVVGGYRPVELLHDLRDRGHLARDEGGRWIEGTTLDWTHLPVRVEAAIAERVGQLPDSQRAMLTVASVEGEEFTAEVVARVQVVEEDKVARALSGALSKRYQMVVPQSLRRIDGATLSRYRFRHHLFQQYLYGQMDEVERARLHGSVGQALETLHRAGSEEIAVQLAWHFELAGLPEKAVSYLMRQATDSWQANGPPPGTVLQLLIQAAACLRRERWIEAAQALEEAKVTMECIEERGLEAELHRLHGELLLSSGANTGEAERCFLKAIEVARRQEAKGWELRRRPAWPGYGEDKAESSRPANSSRGSTIGSPRASTPLTW
jgi:tetratricopeptide (TPR) repeat protein